MRDTIFPTFLGVCFAGCFLMTLKLAIFGGKREFGKFIGYLTNSIWGLLLLLLLPMYLGDYARGDVSPIPWTAARTDFEKHGWFDAIFQCTAITIVDLWVLWLPASLWLEWHPEVDKRTYYLVWATNILAGLLLLTPHNPFSGHWLEPY